MNKYCIIRLRVRVAPKLPPCYQSTICYRSSAKWRGLEMWGIITIIVKYSSLCRIFLWNSGIFPGSKDTKIIWEKNVVLSFEWRDPQSPEGSEPHSSIQIARQWYRVDTENYFNKSANMRGEKCCSRVNLRFSCCECRGKKNWKWDLYS